MPALTPVTVFWFRRDLRLTDNTGLFYALKEQAPVLPVFIFDRNILADLDDPADARVAFIHSTLRSLKNRLEGIGSSLRVIHDTPEGAFNRLTADFKVKSVYTNRDYEPYALQRDETVRQLLHDKGISFYTFKDHVIFEKGEILNDAGEPYKVFTPYKNKWLTRLTPGHYDTFPDALTSGHFLTTPPFSMPSLDDIGFSDPHRPIPPAEFDKSLISRYDKTRDFPGTEGTTRLGLHLRHGTVSVRQAVKVAISLNDTWLSELIWREFYQMILFHFPHVVTRAFKPQYDNIPWLNNQEAFARWCEGSTGYPIVDAGMRELTNTGYMHNRVRMIVASFLTKHLLTDWRWGEAWFAKKLLDFELASNNGGWQWAAGTGTDAQPYFRVFNPDSQTEKFDKNRDYVRQWVPEFDSKSYAKPIVDHKFARQRAIDTYQQALK